MTRRRLLRLTVNGRAHEVLAFPHQTLLELLREDLDLTGTKFGCELGECGACTVLLEGEPTLACSTLALLCEGRSVTTVEGLEGDLAQRVAEAFEAAGGSQCGYCTPGMAVMFHHLLQRDDGVEVEAELSGNLCRCTGYAGIRKAFERARTRG
jgi:carbon-monoxide dehydrogenase small subunit